MPRWSTGRRCTTVRGTSIVSRSFWPGSSARTTRRRGTSWATGLSSRTTWCSPPVSPHCRVWCVSRHGARGRVTWPGRLCDARQGATAATTCRQAVPMPSRNSVTCWTGTCGRGRTTTWRRSVTCSRSRSSITGSAVLGDFSDDFYQVDCPQCAVEVTIAIGGHGRYSAIRDWHLGDVDRRDLRPASPEAISGVGRWMHETAVRDGEVLLADGIAHLFGRAECPRCAAVFGIADEYASSNRPLM